MGHPTQTGSSAGVPQWGIRPRSDRFDEAGEAWLEQEDELFSALAGAGVELVRVGPAGSGGKGIAEMIVMSVTSAGTITAASSVLKAWLARDRTRRVELTTTKNGKAITRSITAVGVDDDQFDGLVEELLEQLRDRD